MNTKCMKYFYVVITMLTTENSFGSGVCSSSSSANSSNQSSSEHEVKFPSRVILRESFHKAKLDYFLQKTNIDEIADEKVSPLGVAIKVELCLTDFIEYLKRERNAEDARKIEPMVADIKPRILEILLQDDPAALKELQEELQAWRLEQAKRKVLQSIPTQQKNSLVERIASGAVDAVTARLPIQRAQAATQAPMPNTTSSNSALHKDVQDLDQARSKVYAHLQHLKLASAKEEGENNARQREAMKATAAIQAQAVHDATVKMLQDAYTTHAKTSYSDNNNSSSSYDSGRGGDHGNPSSTHADFNSRSSGSSSSRNTAGSVSVCGSDRIDLFRNHDLKLHVINSGNNIKS